MIIRVTTGSRLHFGLFSVPGQKTTASRQFGGVGLMVEQPGLMISVQPAQQWSVSGAVHERARALAAKVVKEFAIAEAFDLRVESCPPEHVGLGTGTQLSLAIALALTSSAGQSPDPLDLARRLGRGQRSALGIHGFIHGGFLVEAGKGPSTAISPLVAHVKFPENWRILLILPQGSEGCHGQPETQAFADLAQLDPVEKETDALCRLTLLGMLPALQEADLPAFGEGLHEFNRRVGEMFRPAQGGIYSHPITEDLVRFLRQQGVPGTGQSSWGPTVLAVTDADRAEHIAGLVRERFGLQENEVAITRARNQGATCVSEPPA